MSRFGIVTSRSIWIASILMLVLLVSSCEHRISPGLTTPVVSLAPHPNLKVRWERPEVLYTDSLDAPIYYPINLDGTLAVSITRYDIDNKFQLSPQFETSISCLTASSDHRSVYFKDIPDPLNRVGQYRVDLRGVPKATQMFSENDKTLYPRSLALAGRSCFLYILYDQYSGGSHMPNHYLLTAYRAGAGRKFVRLPGPPVVVATYATGAFLADRTMVSAYAITGPSSRFLYVMRPKDQYLDIYRLGINGRLLTPPVGSLTLGYKPGRAVFHPAGHTLYIADADHASLKTYRIGTNGIPVLLPGTVPGVDPDLDPTGRFLYAVPRWGQTLFCYAVSPGGTLRLQGATATHNFCRAPCVDATGRFVYALGQDPIHLDEHGISQFRITSNGTLTPLYPEQVPAVGSTTLVTAQASP